MTYSTRQIGALNTLDYKLYIEKDGKPISPFHDIPLYADESNKILNMIVEIPRWTNAKLEISKETILNPIIQDTKKGKLRFVKNSFPYKGYIVNYGALPQTWEDPNVIDSETNAIGDNDPLDILEIGERVSYPGEIKQVKILGVVALLDDGETDWKIIAIDIKDPLASKLNDYQDINKYFPGLLNAIDKWFRIYKIPDGKPENVFAFNGECKDKKYAENVIEECNNAWKKLIDNKVKDNKGCSLINTTLSNTPGYKPDIIIPQANPLTDAPIDKSIDKWFFISDNIK